MKAKFTTLAAFAAAASTLATEQRDLLYTEGDGPDDYCWSASDMWECLLSSCEFEGLRLVREADLPAAKVLFLPVAEAALVAQPQVLVGDLVVELGENGQPTTAPARLVGFEWFEATLELDGRQWVTHRCTLRLHERRAVLTQVAEAC